MDRPAYDRIRIPGPGRKRRAPADDEPQKPPEKRARAGNAESFAASNWSVLRLNLQAAGTAPEVAAPISSSLQARLSEAQRENGQLKMSLRHLSGFLREKMIKEGAMADHLHTKIEESWRLDAEVNELRTKVVKQAKRIRRAEKKLAYKDAQIKEAEAQAEEAQKLAEEAKAQRASASQMVLSNSGIIAQLQAEGAERQSVYDEEVVNLKREINNLHRSQAAKALAQPLTAAPTAAQKREAPSEVRGAAEPAAKVRRTSAGRSQEGLPTPRAVSAGPSTARKEKAARVHREQLVLPNGPTNQGAPKRVLRSQGAALAAVQEVKAETEDQPRSILASLGLEEDAIPVVRNGRVAFPTWVRPDGQLRRRCKYLYVEGPVPEPVDNTKK
ncbi:MAG: hypothetical protein M1826_005691 [Phylliscum demangeonii]|nr:MAG: hypothetical protein M1826_005691 [Phylliscum demangeonii]